MGKYNSKTNLSVNGEDRHARCKNNISLTTSLQKREVTEGDGREQKSHTGKGRMSHIIIRYNVA